MVQSGSEIQLLKYVPEYRKTFYRNPITFFRLHQVSFIYLFFFFTLKNWFAAVNSPVSFILAFQ
jgi:hypothetical protein